MTISTKNALFFAFFALLGISPNIKANHQPKYVIFLFEDLYKSDRASMASKIGFFNSLWNLSTAVKAQEILFKALFSKFGHQHGTYKAYDPQTKEELPIPFTEWLLGKDPKVVLDSMKLQLKSYKFPNGDSDRKFIFTVLDIIFDPTKMASSFGVTADTLKLLEKIVQGPAHPQLILAANSNDKTFDALSKLKEGQKALPYFNAIYVSGKEKIIIEDRRFFENIIAKHGGSPSDYLVIGGNKHVNAVAHDLGMQTVFSPDGLYAAGKKYCLQYGLIKK